MRFWLLTVAVCLAPTVVSAQSVAVVASTPEDEAVAGHLSTLEDVTPRALALEGEAPHNWLPAAGALGEPLVVVIRRGESVVHILRPADGTVLTRSMDAALSAESAVAVALVAAELVGVARQLSQTPSHTPPQTPEHSEPDHSREPSPEQDLEAEARSPVGAAFALGLSFAASPGNDVSLVAGLFLAELHLARGGPAWLVIGGAATTPGSWSRDLGGPTMERAEYQRFDLSLRLGVGFGVESTRAVLAAVVGLSLVEARVVGQTGASLGEESSARGTLGLEVSLRQRLWEGLFVAGNVGVTVVPEPTRYLVRGVPEIREGHVRLLASLVLGWEL